MSERVSKRAGRRIHNKVHFSQEREALSRQTETVLYQWIWWTREKGQVNLGEWVHAPHTLPKASGGHIAVSDCEANSRPLPAEDGQEQKAGGTRAEWERGQVSTSNLTHLPECAS